MIEIVWKRKWYLFWSILYDKKLSIVFVRTYERVKFTIMTYITPDWLCSFFLSFVFCAFIEKCTYIYSNHCYSHWFQSRIENERENSDLNMALRTLSVVDYVLLVVLLLASAVIGALFGFVKSKKSSAKEFLLGTIFPNSNILLTFFLFQFSQPSWWWYGSKFYPDSSFSNTNNFIFRYGQLRWV